MEQYIGTKIIQAEPAFRISDNEILSEQEFKSQPLTGEPGYKVVYPDGYESWSPKDAFEKAYRQNNNLTFGLALEAVKKGCKIARAGWNGKGQYVTLIPAGNAMFQGFNMQNCLGLKNAQDNMQPGWIPSIGDCMADDWYIAIG